MAITLETVSTIFATMSIASVISAVAILIFLKYANKETIKFLVTDG